MSVLKADIHAEKNLREVSKVSITFENCDAGISEELERATGIEPVLPAWKFEN